MTKELCIRLKSGNIDFEIFNFKKDAEFSDSTEFFINIQI